MIGGVEHDAKNHHGPADHGRGTEQIIPSHQFEDQAENHHRDGRDDQTHGQKRTAGVDLSPQKAQGPDGGLAHIGPEIENDRAEGADMDGDIDHLALVVQPRQIRQKNQMTRGGNRKKFGDPLDQGDEEKVKEAHQPSTRRISYLNLKPWSRGENLQIGNLCCLIFPAKRLKISTF